MSDAPAIDPVAALQPFDAWHAACFGTEAHEMMRRQRVNAIVDQQIERALAQRASFVDVGGRRIMGPLVIPHDGCAAIDEREEEGVSRLLITMGRDGEILDVQRVAF